MANGKWKMANGIAASIYHLPFSFFHRQSIAWVAGREAAVFSCGTSPASSPSAPSSARWYAWNPDDGQKKGEFAGFGREVFGLATYQDKIFTCSGDKTVQQHRADLKQFKVYPGHTDAVYAVAFHPGTGRVAAGGFSGEVRIWNAEDAAPVATFVAAPGYNPAPPVPMAAAK